MAWVNLINPNPYKTNIKRLLLVVCDIPKDQKKKIALSSQGINVWRIPKVIAEIKTTNNGCGKNWNSIILELIEICFLT